MKHGNWVPIDARLAKFLPKDRAYSEVEAAYCLQLNYDKESPVTVAGLASAWGWTRKRTARFLKDSGIEIIYPKGMGSRWGKMTIKEPEWVQVGVQVRDRFGTGSGQVRVINNKYLDDERYRFGTGSGQVGDRLRPTINHTTYPNPENNNIADSVPESANLNLTKDENGQDKKHNGKILDFGARGIDRQGQGESLSHNELPAREDIQPGNQTLLPGIGEQGTPGEGEGSGEDLSIPTCPDNILTAGELGKTTTDDLRSKPSGGNGRGGESGIGGNDKKLEEPRYRTKKNRWLKGQRLADFEEFWIAFDYKKGKAAAADSWLDIKDYSPEKAKWIIYAAKKEAWERDGIIQRGGAPKWAQGWLTDRRWEDYPMEAERSKKPARTKEQIRAEVYAKYGRKDLQAAATGPNGKVATGNLVGEGSRPPGTALQVLFGK